MSVKSIRFNRIFQILYPIIVYLVVYQMGYGLIFSMLGDEYGSLPCLLIAACICLVPIYLIYRAVPHLIPKENITQKDIVKYIFWVFCIVILGLVLNYILTWSGLTEYSDGFKRATSTLTNGTLLIKILCNVLAVPALEELLVRGIVAGQLAVCHNPIVAIVFSSIFFGILHNNIVQFIYALVIGLALGVMYINTKRLSLCIIAHALINLLVIIISNF